MFRIVRTLISCILLVATAAQAQITTSHVKVLVRGKRCSELKNLYLVINGNDLETRWVKLDPDGSCRWTTDLGSSTISTGNARFSFRGDFGNRGDVARSDCQKAAANEEDLSANLEFACCDKGPFRNVSVKIEPPIPATYVRDVRPFAGARVPGLKDCTEYGTFEGQAAIGYTQFTGEDVFLHLGPHDPKRKGFGLLLDDVVVDDGPLVLTRDGVVYRLIVQRAQGKSRSAPTLSSNAASLDIKKLGALKFEQAEIEVIK